MRNNSHLHLSKHIYILCALIFSVAGCTSNQQSLDYVQVINGSVIEFDMVWIAEGNFWIGQTEVTWDEFLLYCDFEEKSEVPPGVDAVTKPSEPITAYDHYWGFGNRPAVGMSLSAAREYCRWITLNTGKHYQLPTETEWEIACGLTGYEPLGKYAWYADNSEHMTHKVGQKSPNQHGLYDMLGNLWEYCQNPYDEKQSKRPVLRGGSWKDLVESILPTSRLGFDYDWILSDPNVPPGVWWIPDGNHLGFRILRRADNER